MEPHDPYPIHVQPLDFAAERHNYEKDCQTAYSIETYVNKKAADHGTTSPSRMILFAEIDSNLRLLPGTARKYLLFLSSKTDNSFLIDNPNYKVDAD